MCKFENIQKLFNQDKKKLLFFFYNYYIECLNQIRNSLLIKYILKTIRLK
jgi:hypothetical protein